MPSFRGTPTASGAVDVNQNTNVTAIPSGSQRRDVAVLVATCWHASADPIPTWPPGFVEFLVVSAPIPGNGTVRMKLAAKRLSNPETGNYNVSYSITNWNLVQAYMFADARLPKIMNTAVTTTSTSVPSTAVIVDTLAFLLHIISTFQTVTITTPATGYTVQQDGSVLHVSFLNPAVIGTNTAAGGVISGTSEKDVALLAIEPDASDDPNPIVAPAFITLDRSIPIPVRIYLATIGNQDPGVEAVGGAGTVGVDLSLPWDTRALIADDSQLQWGVRTSLGDELQMIWGVRTLAGQSVQALWDVRAALGDTVDVRWDVRAALGDSADLRWDVRAAVSDSADLRWAVRAIAGQSSILRWDTRSAPGKSLSLPWSVRSVIGDVAQLIWSARVVAGDDLQVIWSTRLAVGDDEQLIWDVLATGIIAVGKSLSIPWDVRQALGDSADLRWAVRTSIGDSADLRWAARILAGDSVQALWSVKAPAAKDIALRWDTRAAVSSGADLRWAIRTIAGADFAMLWVTRSNAGKSVVLLWEVDGVSYTPLEDGVMVLLVNESQVSIIMNDAQSSIVPNEAEIRWK